MDLKYNFYPKIFQKNFGAYTLTDDGAVFIYDIDPYGNKNLDISKNYKKFIKTPTYDIPTHYIPSKNLVTTDSCDSLTINSQFQEKNLEWILGRIEKEKKPIDFKERILESLQLYFDGLVEQKMILTNPKAWDEQLTALDALFKGAHLTIKGFYRGNMNIPFDKVREIILQHDSNLIKYGSNLSPKRRHLRGCETKIADYAEKISNTLKDKGIDLVVPIASGGFEAAILTADYLNVNNFLPVRYSAISRNDTEVLIPVQAPKNYVIEKISENRILLVDDILSSGMTGGVVSQWSQKFSPIETYLAFVHSINEHTDLKHHNLNRDDESNYLYKHEKAAA